VEKANNLMTGVLGLCSRGWWSLHATISMTYSPPFHADLYVDTMSVSDPVLESIPISIYLLYHVETVVP
jgi:hypothetical protein